MLVNWAGVLTLEAVIAIVARVTDTMLGAEGRTVVSALVLVATVRPSKAVGTGRFAVCSRRVPARFANAVSNALPEVAPVGASVFCLAQVSVLVLRTRNLD